MLRCFREVRWLRLSGRAAKYVCELAARSQELCNYFGRLGPSEIESLPLIAAQCLKLPHL